MTIQTFYYACGIVFATATCFFGMESWKANKKIAANDVEKRKAEDRINQLCQYIKKTPTKSYIYADAIFIGPRFSGKTTIAKLWTNARTNTTDIAASASWELFEGDVCELEEEDREQEEIGLRLQYIPTLRVRCRVYPGEDRFRTSALASIGKMQSKVALLMTLHSEYVDGDFRDSYKNSQYYSAIWLHDIENCIREAGHNIVKVFVVITKSDFFPSEWDEKTIIENIKKNNEGVITNFERLFGDKIQYSVVSAHTNRNIINLLALVSEDLVSEEQRSEIRLRLSPSYHLVQR